MDLFNNTTVSTPKIKRDANLNDRIPDGLACGDGVLFYCPGGHGGLADGELHRRIRGGGSRSDNAAEIHRLVHLYRHERIRICPGGETSR